MCVHTRLEWKSFPCVIPAVEVFFPTGGGPISPSDACKSHRTCACVFVCVCVYTSMFMYEGPQYKPHEANTEETQVR